MMKTAIARDWLRENPSTEEENGKLQDALAVARKMETPKCDPVKHPAHYTQHPSGVECIEITQHMGFNLGNAVKYIWRADLKCNTEEDLRKAAWYINQELKKRGYSNS